MPASGTDLVFSDSWYKDSSWEHAGTREFMASVELWVPAAKAANVTGARKPNLPRKASEKRDSINAVLGGDERKLREKPSWFRSHTNSAAVNGIWRSARCRLLEEHDRCTLNIYVDETILQYSIYVHLLRCTDIRPADRSLFFENNCLGIHVKPGQRWLDQNTEEIVYMKFLTSDALNTWLALLRSYGIPEIYGRNYAPNDGGLYRMWRQVQLEINQARNLGLSKSPADLASSPMSSDFDGANDGVDMEVSCEVHISDTICGRTTVKKGSSSPEWHEQLTFSDLPPFGDLLIHVYREKKVFKPQLLGTVQINLGNFRRGEHVEGWFPVTSMNQSVGGLQIGELRLSVRVDEEIVLPTSAYSSIIECMSKGNILDILEELEQQLKLKHVAEHVIAVAVARNVLIRDLFELAEREVGGTSPTQNTLFRGNSVLTKTMELAMNWFGKSFLEASVGPTVRQLMSKEVVIEVDPVRSGRGQKDQERNVDLLVFWCNELWKQIYSKREECPTELRRLFQHIRQLVERRFESHSNPNLRWQGVSAFCFLRFIVPSILHPHLFGLCHGMPPPPVQRSLTLIAKVLQSLANLNPNLQKEEFMKGAKTFIRDSLHGMEDYLKAVSTPSSEQIRSSSLPSADEHDRIYAMNALRERKATMPNLHREALLFLPHLLDVPRHLAMLTSAVVRNTKYQQVKGPTRYSESLWIFTRNCLDIENTALRYVSQLRPRSHNSRPLSVPLASPTPHQTYSQAGSFQDPADSDQTTKKNGKRRLTVKTARPTTAPSTPDPDSPWENYLEYSAANPPLATSPTEASMPGHSSGSGTASTRTQLTRTSTNTRQNGSLDNNGGPEPGARGRTEDDGESVCSPDALDDNKRRRRFLPGFLTKR